MKTKHTCPYCGGTETIIGKQAYGYASVTLASSKWLFRGQILYHEICKNCGTVVRSYVEDPQKL